MGASEKTVDHKTWEPTPKSRRCYHRVRSGLERGGSFRFLTLTSSRESSPDIHKHFRTLMMRLKRRGLVQGYIQVTEYTQSGLLHKHVVLRGKYIDQHVLSLMWQEIHGAKVVDIRRIHAKSPHRNIAGEMAKYLAKENTLRYSWSWGWVWRAFARDWATLKRRITELTEMGFLNGFLDLLKYWQILLKYGKYVDPMTFYNRCIELVPTC